MAADLLKLIVEYIDMPVLPFTPGRDNLFAFTFDACTSSMIVRCRIPVIVQENR
jgi:hypothetical protein